MSRLLFLGLSLFAILAAPALAQAPAPEQGTRLGSRIPERDTPELAAQREAERVLQQFARCVVDRDGRRAAAVVQRARYGVEITQTDFAETRRSMTRCMTAAGGGAMGTSALVMVGAFAGELYRRGYSRLPALGAAPVPPPAAPGQVTTLTTLAFAACLIDRDPGAADSLVRSSVGSTDEQAAYAGLAGHYPSCLDAGSSLTLNRLTLRSALADQLYRRAIAGAAGAPSGTG